MVKSRVAPCVFTCISDDGKLLNIEIDLPGVEKEDIQFKMTEMGFSVRAHNREDDIEYMGTYTLCCPVVPDKATAAYDNGMLLATVPYEEAHEEVDVDIK
ncbi:conserved hypothetical protein [Methanosalsum zhilinae DSM 4017]|uniref:SHSP domain-containing protein n=1 Tax=Methanosalsum zhilinae (strain DSM 4017 / NBRC 107636 / OCM 62 / WeN5) TaxID=679901 RepID=F7XN68_METZD|nr:Hsp20 family protein [Methanosalsum zhilinae]AEH60025.1 conserved hypothetical protein [Methanosalsum zhilinae DSM 4017]